MSESIISFLITLALGLSIAVLVLYLSTIVRRRRSTYLMYKVRDDLVSLVASERLKESSPIFQYYYNGVNFLLGEAPRVGFDDILESTIQHSTSDNFDESMATAEKKANEMVLLLKREPNIVRDVVSDYYLAQKKMILAHSSFVRMVYILTSKGLPKAFAKSITGSKRGKALEAARFADSKAELFRSGHNSAHAH